MNRPNAENTPTIARLKPCLETLTAGRSYFWCRCGLSRKQPYCDGSHASTQFEPQKFVAVMSGEHLLCACKHTATAPYCDGTHCNLPDGSPLDDPHSPQNCAVQRSTRRNGARTQLNGTCYVFSAAQATLNQNGTLSYCSIIIPEFGSVYQSQFLLRVQGGASPALSFADTHVVLFFFEGSGQIVIGGRSFAIKTTDGVYVRPNESFQLTPRAGSTLQAFASACPLGSISWPAEMQHNFDDRFPQRVVTVDSEQRIAMGPRYFQVLVDKRVGSDVLTQFIGHIPLSKAAPHRHLYEESIIGCRRRRRYFLAK
jgi:CDGSH-type Zn-finger protein/mannose-6-phosphate isomerase-like protein (cupin superfamily)